MPTYEYECTKCNARFEVFQKITDEPIKTCPHCGGKPQRLIGSGIGLIFKGSGFHATDYRSESYKKKQKEEEKTPTPKCAPGADCSSCKRGL